jgi:sugar phosphate isomerase/epimerase
VNDIFLSRRRVLAVMASAAFVGTVSASRAAHAAAAMANAAPPLRWAPGLQLYTLGLKPTDDLAAAFKQVAAIGYREVEMPGRYARSAAELRQLLDAAQLKCPSVHIPPRPMPDAWDFSGDLAKIVDDLHTLGARYAVTSIPYLPDRVYDVFLHPPAGFNMDAVVRLFESLTVDDWQRSADFLNEKGEALAKAGLRLAHHNHGADFRTLPGGKNGFQILVERTDPKFVDFEIDIGWAVSAGQDLDALFKLVGDRARLLHLKDTQRLAKNVMDLVSTDAGTGIVDWVKLRERVRTSKIEHMFVEHEEPFATTPMDAARVDYVFLTKLFAGTAAGTGSGK